MPAGEKAAKRDLGYASEDMRLYKQATLAWHMEFVSSIYAGWDRTYAEHLQRRFDLRSDQKVKGLSHGQRVKAALLLILARRPRLLVLDEPTTGLDPVARQEVLGALMEVLADEGRTILFSSQNTLDVEQISDRITFIDRGRVLIQPTMRATRRWTGASRFPPGLFSAFPSSSVTRESNDVHHASYHPSMTAAYQMRRHRPAVDRDTRGDLWRTSCRREGLLA